MVPKREKTVTKAALAKKALKKQLQINSKLKFNDEGETLADERNQMKALSTKTKKQQKDDDGGINLVLSKALLNEEDQYDKQRFRELVKKRHKLQREKLRKRPSNNRATRMKVMKKIEWKRERECNWMWIAIVRLQWI